MDQFAASNETHMVRFILLVPIFSFKILHNSHIYRVKATGPEYITLSGTVPEIVDQSPAIVEQFHKLWIKVPQ